MKNILKTIIVFISCISFLLQAQNSEQSKIKLFRFGEFGKEKPGVEYPDGTRLDVSMFGEDFNELFFSTDGIKRLQNWLSVNGSKCPKVSANERFGSCVARPSKIVGIGLNYVAHAAEANKPIPNEPVLFLKSTTSLSGPNDNVPIPLNSTKLDWEAELAIVISKKATYVSEENAMNYVAGYATVNDVSERKFQIEGTGQWTKGKSHDGFCPLGPYLVLPSNVDDIQNQRIWLTVNGQTMQESNTKDMIFNVKKLVSIVSQYMTLLPGDVIITGTPSGVGIGKKPPIFLKENDIIELGVGNLGSQKQIVVPYLPSK